MLPVWIVYAIWFGGTALFWLSVLITVLRVRSVMRKLGYAIRPRLPFLPGRELIVMSIMPFMNLVVPLTVLLDGNKVRFVNQEAHEHRPEFYPAVGTIGTILSVLFDENLEVKWPNGSIAMVGSWICYNSDVEPVELVRYGVKIKDQIGLIRETETKARELAHLLDGVLVKIEEVE